MKMLVSALVVSAALTACGGGGDSQSQFARVVEKPVSVEKVVVREVPKELVREALKELPVMSGGFPAPAFPALAATPVSLAPQAPKAGVAGPYTPYTGGESIADRQAAVSVAQQRIIVRYVDMAIVAQDLSGSLDAIAKLTQDSGGWVVSSSRTAKHRAFISFRVPAERLDATVAGLRAMASEVKSEVTTSKDVTDEYVDTTSQLKNLRATEDALLKLMARAEKVEDALKVQTSLTSTQELIERLQGRIKFLEETSAFSLVNVSLELAPADMPVDAGVDQAVSVGQPARFSAKFKPPEGIDAFLFTWDFGDGSAQVTSDRTAPTTDPATRVTATMTHFYQDERDSPFIAEIKMTGTGESGIAEGEDTVIVTVTRLPVIEVFAGEGRVVKEGETVEFSGSFTRPKDVTDLTFKWEFGDGSPAVSGTLPEGATRATATHVYPDHRPFAFTATLTIEGKSAAGEVEASSSLGVFVTESRGWAIAGWSASEEGKTGVRALSGLGQGLGTFLIWVGIFSPLWLGASAVVVFVRRRKR